MNSKLGNHMGDNHHTSLKKSVRKGGAGAPPFNMNWEKAWQTAATPALFAWGAKHLSDKRKKSKKN